MSTMDQVLYWRQQADKKILQEETVYVLLAAPSSVKKALNDTLLNLCEISYAARELLLRNSLNPQMCWSSEVTSPTSVKHSALRQRLLISQMTNIAKSCPSEQELNKQNKHL